MNRLLPAFVSDDLHFASTEASYQQVNPSHPFTHIPEASRNSSYFAILKQALCVFKLVASIRPDVIVSTGASVGFFALLFGKKLGAKTIWVDSIANVDSISMSGEKAKKHADLFITQWQHLAQGERPAWYGAVI